MTRWAFRGLLALIVLVLDPSTRAVQAEEYCFCVIFGSQGHPAKLSETHTWATFVRAVGTGPDLSTYALETVTISWLPATLNIRVLALEPEPGVNLGLEETLRVVRSQGENITAWGPFQVTPLLHQRAQEQFARLQSGQVRYRAISSGIDLTISDCIHAVADIDPEFGRWRYPLVRVGKPASRYIARNIKTRSRFEPNTVDHSWLVHRLGLPSWGVTIVPSRETPEVFRPPLGTHRPGGFRPGH